MQNGVGLPHLGYPYLHDRSAWQAIMDKYDLYHRTNSSFEILQAGDEDD